MYNNYNNCVENVSAKCSAATATTTVAATLFYEGTHDNITEN